MKSVPLTRVPIVDEGDYRDSAIDLLQWAIDKVDSHRIEAVQLPGIGLARLYNLLHWRVDNGTEYIDGDTTTADQVIHLAVHLAVADLTPDPSDGERIWAECLASCTDLYVLGRLTRAGIENDFVIDTMESLAFYFETYAWGTDHLETLLEACLSDPISAMRTVAQSLFAFAGNLRHPPADPSSTGELAIRNIWYPLVHHFNMANWLLVVSGQDLSETGRIRQIREQFLMKESHFELLFRANSLQSDA